MLVKDLRKTLDEWGFVIKRTSKFSDTDRGVFKKLIELCNATSQLGFDEVPEAKYSEIAGHSALNFRESPPPMEEDKENPQLYRLDLLNYLAKHRDEIFIPGHRIYEAFKTFVLLQNANEHESKFSDTPSNDLIGLSIREEQVKTELYMFLTGEVGFSIGSMTRGVFDDIIEDRWKGYVAIVRESVNNLAAEDYVKQIIQTPASEEKLNSAIREINWKSAKDGMLSLCRAFNVVKTLQGNHSDDCFWVMYGAEGGEGKSVYTNGELKHFTNMHLSVYVGDNKVFGEHFNSPEPFQAKLLYVREDESWSPEQIRFKKQLVDHDYIGIEQKGKDAYRITPQCMVTSMTNYRSYDISRRFAIIDYGRYKVGVDIPSLEDYVSIDKFADVSNTIYKNLFDKKEPEYVKDVCVQICKAVQFLNKREDKQWAHNVAMKMVQNLILEKDPDLVNLDAPDYFLIRTALTKTVQRYKKSQDESKIMSNEFYRNNIQKALTTLVENGELSEDIFIGTSNDYNKMVGKEESKQAYSAIIIKNKRSVWLAIENYFKQNTREVDAKEEEEKFNIYEKFLWKIINDGSIIKFNIEQLAAVIECKYEIPV